MNTGTIRLSHTPQGVATITLARAATHNAINLAMIRDLRAAAETLDADPSVRVVILAGEGRSFCAGADLDWMREQSARAPSARLAEA